MNCIILKFKAPPFSLNKAYYKNRQRTTQCRKWGDAILSQLPQYEEIIKSFRDSFDPLKHAMVVDLLFLMPFSKLYTKTGKVSRNSNDLSNIEKLFIDLIFDKRFDERGFTNLCLDDCLNVNLSSYKRSSEDGSFQTVIKVQKILLSDLRSSPLPFTF